MPEVHTRRFYAIVQEDGTFSVLGRLCSLSGTGDVVAAVEGACVEQVDVSSITCRVYEGTSELTPAPTVDVATCISDELRTLGWPTSKDGAGYNFRHDVPAMYVPQGDAQFLFEYEFHLTGGGVAIEQLLVTTEETKES